MTALRRPAAAALLLVLCGGIISPASAQERSTTRGPMSLSVSKASALAVEGERVRVRGSGYDRSKGIYVAFCVVNGPGELPTPCGGGADTEGRSGNSVWISDLPPAYGTGLAQAYGPGGTFDVEISVRAQLNKDVDCRTVQCAVVTRADHTRSEDRSADVIVPVSFDRPAASTAPRPAESTAAPPASGGSTGPAPNQVARSSAGRPAAAAAAQPPPSAAAPEVTPEPDPSLVAAAAPVAPEVPVEADAEADVVAGDSGPAPAEAATDQGGSGWPLAAAALLAATAAALGAGSRVLARRPAPGDR